MKKLILLLIVVLTICVPAYADLLVYQVGIDERGITDDGENSYFGGEHVHAFLVMDVDFDAYGNPTIIDSSLVLYDRIGGKVQVTIDDVIYNIFTDAISPKGYATGVYCDTSLFHAYLTGKSKAKAIGAAVKRIIPADLKGAMLIDEDPFTGDDVFGSGVVHAVLKAKWTKTLNKSGATFAEAVAAVEQYLLDKGYEPI